MGVQPGALGASAKPKQVLAAYQFSGIKRDGISLPRVSTPQRHNVIIDVTSRVRRAAFRSAGPLHSAAFGVSVGLLGSVAGLVTAFVSAPIYAVASPLEDWRRQTVPPKKRVDFDPSIKTLVVVAGVSGSGKSTFIKQLLTASLSDEIAALLPQDVRLWNFVGEKIPRARRLRAPREEQPDGQIIHYEITQAYRPCTDEEFLPPAPEDYWACEDIRSMHMIAAAERVYLVVVQAPGEQLASQLGNRSLLLHIPTPLRPLFARWGGCLHAMEARLPAWIFSGARFFGRRWLHRSKLRERNSRLIELYRRPLVLANIYREWPRTLHESWGRRIVGGTLRVSPAADNLGREGFKLHESSLNSSLSGREIGIKG